MLMKKIRTPDGQENPRYHQGIADKFHRPWQQDNYGDVKIINRDDTDQTQGKHHGW